MRRAEPSPLKLLGEKSRLIQDVNTTPRVCQVGAAVVCRHGRDKGRSSTLGHVRPRDSKGVEHRIHPLIGYESDAEQDVSGPNLTVMPKECFIARTA